jgi:glyoxylase-like metal-dependent hydrolase (beta-lactamase superfamily II)
MCDPARGPYDPSVGSTARDATPVGDNPAGPLTGPATAVLDAPPPWAVLVRAPNPGPMTLDGTNSWVLRAPGHRGCVVVDPGPDDEGHLRRLAEAGPVERILVTHSHDDHVGGLARFAELTGAPVGGPERFTAAGLAVEAVRTPGHTADSVCFVVTPEDPGAGGPAVLTGDTVLGRGTTVVMWPDGDLGDYLASLARLAELGALPVLPGHGPALADCAAAAGHYLAHRRARLAQVADAVAAGAGTPRQVVERVYADVDRSVWPAAELTVRAQLAHLGIADSDREHNPPPAPLDPT